MGLKCGTGAIASLAAKKAVALQLLSGPGGEAGTWADGFQGDDHVGGLKGDMTRCAGGRKGLQQERIEES